MKTKVISTAVLCISLLGGFNSASAEQSAGVLSDPATTYGCKLKVGIDAYIHAYAITSVRKIYGNGHGGVDITFLEMSDVGISEKHIYWLILDDKLRDKAIKEFIAQIRKNCTK